MKLAKLSPGDPVIRRPHYLEKFLDYNVFMFEQASAIDGRGGSRERLIAWSPDIKDPFCKKALGFVSVNKIVWDLLLPLVP